MSGVIDTHNKGLHGYTIVSTNNHEIKEITDRKSFFRDMQEMWRVATLDESEAYPSVQLLQKNVNFKNQALKNFQILFFGLGSIALGAAVMLTGAVLMNPIPLAIGALFVVTGLILCVIAFISLHRQRADKKAILFDNNALFLKVNQEILFSSVSTSRDSLREIKSYFEGALNTCLKPKLSIQGILGRKTKKEVDNPFRIYSEDMQEAQKAIKSAYTHCAECYNALGCNNPNYFIFNLKKEVFLTQINYAVEKVSFVLTKIKDTKGKDNKPLACAQRLIKTYLLDSHLVALKKMRADWEILNPNSGE